MVRSKKRLPPSRPESVVHTGRTGGDKSLAPNEICDLPSLGVCGLVGLASFLLYLRTLAPTITWAHDGADGGDLITAAVVGGIAHPPGYPLYLLLARLFLLLPLGDPAYRLNLMSAFWGAASVVMLAIAIYLTRPPRADRWTVLAGALAALFFALAPIPWDQAAIAEVYALHTFLSGLIMTLLVILVVHHPRSRLFLFGLGLAVGIASGNHLTVLLLVPALALGLWLGGRTNWAGLAVGLVGLAIGSSIYIYLPLLAAHDPPVSWGDVTTWSGFWAQVSAESYRQFAFALPLQYVPQRILALTQIWLGQYSLLGFALGVWGWDVMRRTTPKLLWPLTVGTILETIYALFYNTTDSYVYLLPALWIFAIWMAWGLADLAARAERSSLGWRSVRLSHVVLIASLLLVIWQLGHYAEADLSRDCAAADYGQGVLQAADPNAIVIADTDEHIFTLWYYRFALGERPDVTIVVMPLYPYTWYRQQLARHDAQLRGTDQILLPAFVEANRGQRPINFTDPSPNFSALGAWRWDGKLAHLEK